jgi:hypothetical protein
MNRTTNPHAYTLTRWLFLRALALIYLFAFGSLSTQITGLIGEHGILPVSNYFRAIHDYYGAESFQRFPTLVWFNSSDANIQFLTIAGMLLSVLLLLDIAPLLVTGLLWGLYLSLVTAGQVFLRFQWDILLLETGFLAIFLAPPHIVPRLSQRSPSVIIIWLFRWLIFRLMFSSGVVKLASGDPTWRSLSALSCHYFTQPLPTPVAWYMQQLPPAFQQISTLAVFMVELVIPFFIFGPRHLRLIAAGAIVSFQLMIALTGNYTFFNWLTIALCVPLLDDVFLRRLLPAKLDTRFNDAVGELRIMHADPSLNPSPSTGRDFFLSSLAGGGRAGDGGKISSPTVPFNMVSSHQTVFTRFVMIVLATMIIPLGLMNVPGVLARQLPIPQPVRELTARLAPFRVVNGYGLFAVMTTTRPEIIVEGSNDGEVWQPYEFRYKPGDVQRPPPWVAPHQPRLDWQMWFAALGPHDQSPWFAAFMTRLLEGAPEVLALLDDNPFPNAPPRYVRALIYDYRFSTFVERNESGTWWIRRLDGEYFPMITILPTP